MKRIYFSLILICLSLNLSAQWTTIKNGALWKDNNGNSVQAHGAGFLQVGTKWYMVGEDRTSWNAGVNLYSTTDFVTWKLVRKIIPPSAYSSSRFIERPKLLKCPSTGKFVVWCHYEQGDYGASEAASFVCDSVNGQYTLSFSGRPMGIKSRDCNVFVDNDGKGYFVSTTDENQHLTLFELSTDYLTPVKSTRLSTFDWKAREAPAIVRVGNTYFLISSLCTGWDPNQATISYSTSLTSGWSSMVNIGNSSTFDTQAASILTIRGTSGTSYLYVGDRWQDPGLAESKTIIFPITFSGTTCTFNYRQQFDIDFTTGLTRETPITNRVPKTNWKIRAVSSQETSSENGAAINAIDGSTATKWHTKYSGTPAVAPHYIEIDMGSSYTVSGLLCAPRMDNPSFNGLVREFLLSVSNDGNTWTTVTGGSWMPYYSEIYFQPIEARYFRFTAISGTYASVSEFDMLQNTPSYTISNVTPTYQIGTGSWLQSSNISVNQGSVLNFAPGSIGYGTWAWSGPNNRTNNARTYTIPNVAFADSGKYTACFLSSYNQTSKTDINIDVNVDLLVYRRKLNYSIKRAQAVYAANMTGASDLNSCIVLSQQMTYASYGATKDQLENQIEILENQLKTYIQLNIAKATNKTNLITTPNTFTSLTPSGWTGGFTSYGSGCGEFYNDSIFTFTQTLTNLTNGKYLVGVKALYRYGDNDAGISFENSNERQYALFYAGAKSIFISSLYSVPYSGTGNLNGYCNTLTAASTLFNNSNSYYDNWLLADVTDGKLTIKIYKPAAMTNDWCVVNNFQLYSMDEISAVNEIREDIHIFDDKIYTIDGRYIGKGVPQTLRLKPGIYIYNRSKFVVTKE